MFLSRPIYPLDLTVDLDLRVILVWDHDESNNTKPKAYQLAISELVPMGLMNKVRESESKILRRNWP